MRKPLIGQSSAVKGEAISPKRIVVLSHFIMNSANTLVSVIRYLRTLLAPRLSLMLIFMTVDEVVEAVGVDEVEAVDHLVGAEDAEGGVVEMPIAHIHFPDLPMVLYLSLKHESMIVKNTKALQENNVLGLSS